MDERKLDLEQASVPVETLIEALRSRSAYPHPTSKVEFFETHISYVFVTDHRAYKIKKPVTLEFLDYSTLERRQHFCELEVLLNRRLCPEVYLGVTPIVMADDGKIQVGGPGRILEYAVEMQNLPQEQMLDQVLDRGEVDNELMRALADLLVAFHANAETGPGVDEHGFPSAVQKTHDENLEQLKPFSTQAGEAEETQESTLTETLLDHLKQVSRRFFKEHERLLQSRVDRGRIRDGHGDLHSRNICVLPDRIAVFDCIEFSREFRCCDVAADLGFLGMDLDLRGFRGFSQFLFHRYQDRSGDRDLAKLFRFYKMHYACVRGLVAAIRAQSSTDSGEAREAVDEARKYLHLAASYALPPALILTCGLPASGKSWLSRRLAQPFEALILRSDLLRRTQNTAAARNSPADQNKKYSEEATEQIYHALCEQAAESVASGRTVIVDATFKSRVHRRLFQSLAKKQSIPFVVVHTTAADEVIRPRMQQRAKDSAELSEADYDVYRQMKAVFEEPSEIEDRQRVVHAAGERELLTTQGVIDKLIRQLDRALDLTTSTW